MYVWINARHGRGTAWARHAMCESALLVPEPIFLSVLRRDILWICSGSIILRLVIARYSSRVSLSSSLSFLLCRWTRNHWERLLQKYSFVPLLVSSANAPNWNLIHIRRLYKRVGIQNTSSALFLKCAFRLMASEWKEGILYWEEFNDNQLRNTRLMFTNLGYKGKGKIHTIAGLEITERK